MPESPELTLLRDIFHFLQSPEADSLLHIHPNQLCSPSFSVPSLWHCWWTWAGELDNASTPEENAMGTSPDPKWLRLLRHYASPDDARLDIPLELKELVDVARRLQITRHPGPVLPVSTPPLPDDPPHHPGCLLRHAELSMKSKHSSNGESGFVEAVMDPSWSRGMSPKKAHEVLRMTEFTSRLLSQPSLRGVRHVVDVGAGQAYLSRKLRDDLGLHVLALDWSDIQSKGAARKESHNHKASQKPRRTSADPPSNQFPVEKTKAAAQITRPKGSLVYKTVQVTQSSLVDATNDWVRDNSSHAEPTGEQVVSFPETPVPILFVALHACGSLTPNVLRTLISRLKSAETAHTADTARSWTPRAAVIVGCCYNLLDPTDFPLSCALSHSPSNIGAVALTPNHMQLAAQVPCQWLRTEESLGAAGLAIRKVAWRALLEDRLAQHEGEDSTDSTTIPTAGQSPPEEPRRLGRLNDSAYRDWDPFLARAGLKFGVDLTKGGRRKDRAMESRIEVFQVLRCLLGPVVESLIILDRQQWLAEQLEGTMMESQLVNLFDQASGSGRNVAIAIAPGLSQTPIH